MHPKLNDEQEKLYGQLQNELKDWLLNVSEHKVLENGAYENYRLDGMGWGVDFYEWVGNYYDLAYYDKELTVYYPNDRNYFLDFIEYYENNK